MSKARNATNAGYFGECRVGGENTVNDAPFLGLVYSADFTTVDEKTAIKWERAVARWHDQTGFRQHVVTLAAADIADGRHFSLSYIIEAARRETYTGRDCEEFKQDNDLKAAYARLLVMDLPEAAEHIELRKSRFDACISGHYRVAMQPSLFDDAAVGADGSGVEHG